jgi:hypothetical protein
LSGVGEGEFELDWGEFAERSLTASAVVGVFDPGDDRVLELGAGAPAAPVEDVGLQQRPERGPFVVKARGVGVLRDW